MIPKDLRSKTFPLIVTVTAMVWLASAVLVTPHSSMERYVLTPAFPRIPSPSARLVPAPVAEKLSVMLGGDLGSVQVAWVSSGKPSVPLAL